MLDLHNFKLQKLSEGAYDRDKIKKDYLKYHP